LEEAAMRRIAYGLLTALSLALPAVVKADPVQDTILNQIEAFKADDFATAFTFASPSIKSIFMSPENFGAMVKNGYPMVHRPGEVRMLEQRMVAGRLWQKVMITDQAGQTHVLDYQMIETPEGWQINGVQLLPEPGVGA
jgi:hypothetical protein